MNHAIPQSIFEYLQADSQLIDPELDEIHLLDGTVIPAKDFKHAFPEMIQFLLGGKKYCYAPYSAIAKIITSDKS